MLKKLKSARARSSAAALLGLLTLLGGTNAFVFKQTRSVGASIGSTCLTRNQVPLLPQDPFCVAKTPGGIYSKTVRHVLEPSALLTSGDISSSGGSGVMSPLTAFFLETLIRNGVTAFFSIAVIGFVAFLFGRSRKDRYDSDLVLKTDNPAAAMYDDLYGDLEQGERRGFFFGGDDDKIKLRKNSGIPKDQFLTVTHLNRKYESYDYSLMAATNSKAAAAANFRKKSFRRALSKALSGPTGLATLPPSTMMQLQRAEAKFLEEGRVIVSELQRAQTKLTLKIIDGQLKKMGLEPADRLDPAEGSGKKNTKKLPKDSNVTATATANTSNTTGSDETVKLETKSNTGVINGRNSPMAVLAMLELQELEMCFIRDVIKALGPVQGPAFRAALLGDVAARGTGGLLLLSLEERPLSTLLGGSTAQLPKPRVFLTRFSGDVGASQVSNLREEVTSIVRAAQPGDEALVVLQTGGGTVTGYGLAAAQLQRFKEAGMKLTIAVEQVAASGGYMMSCVADRIVASPFAVLGSIGVISDIPNVYARLKSEGIEYQTVTAGKYKRTLTPTKKVTKEDFEKTKANVENIFVLFRDFVAQNRPQLNIDEVATGEVWFGTAALDRGLCDEIRTVDDLLMDYVNSGYDVYEVKYSPTIKSGRRGLVAARYDNTNEYSFSGGGLIRRAIRWLIQIVAKEATAAALDSSFSSEMPLEQRYRAEDDIASRIKARD